MTCSNIKCIGIFNFLDQEDLLHASACNKASNITQLTSLIKELLFLADVEMIEVQFKKNLKRFIIKFKIRACIIMTWLRLSRNLHNLCTKY